MGGLGFRDLELFNLALLSRQVWRLLQESDMLSARVLKARYYPHVDILDAALGAHPSQVWCSILEGRDILALGLIKRIGSRIGTRIWEDNWLPREEMMRPYGCISANPPVMVSELINATNATWNIPLLNTTFMTFDATVISASHFVP